MQKATRYRFRCTTEGVDKFVVTSDDDAIPSKCPTDSSHAIDIDSLSIIDALDKDTVTTEARVGKTSDKMKLRGTSFVAIKGVITEHTYLIDELFFIKDGMLITDKNIPQDNISIELLDANDNKLHDYVKEYPLKKGGETGFVDETLSDVDFNGLKLKFTYDSRGTEDVICEMQLNGSV